MKTMAHKFNKWTAGALILSQVCTCLGATALQAAESNPSPELVLITQTEALRGENLSHKETLRALQKIETDYLASAPSEGQLERIQSALVDAGIYTESQAQELIYSVQITSDKVAASESPEEKKSETSELFAKFLAQPKGAQFSVCNFYDGGDEYDFIEGILYTGSVVTVIAGAVEYTHAHSTHISNQVGVNLFDTSLGLGVLALIMTVIVTNCD